METDKFLEGIFEVPNKDMELSGKVMDYSPIIILRGGGIPKDKFIRISEEGVEIKNYSHGSI